MIQVVTIALGLTAGDGEVTATSYSPVALDRCVERAAVIAAGTVASITPHAIGGTVVSTVAFREVTFLRDRRESPAPNLEIRVLGGYVNGHGVIDEGGPKFVQDGRYILLLEHGLGTKRDGYTPIVYFNQGFYPVRTGEGSSSPVVYDWLGRVIVGVHKGRIVALDSSNARVQHKGERRTRVPPFTPVAVESLALNAPPDIAVVLLAQERDPGTRFSEVDFLAQLRKLMVAR